MEGWRGAEDRSDAPTFGTGVVAGFLAWVLQEKNVDILPSHPVTQLLTDGDGNVVGVRAQGPDGMVERRGPIVLATNTYDWDPELVQEMVGLNPEEFGSVAPDSLRADGIKHARAVGGVMAKIPATSVPMLPGWKSGVGSGFAYGPDYAIPHSMIVDKTGKRYCDDPYWVDSVAK